MSPKEALHEMLVTVAEALGKDLRQRLVFVGGCTTVLLVTDEHAQDGVRYTYDVDLIVDLTGHAEWAELQVKLGQSGFTVSMEDDLICRMRLGDLKVDFMPTDEKILGFTNMWYKAGIACAEEFQLTENLKIKILPAPIFMATKFEAYLDRGNNDPLGSHDLEDILWLVDGRRALLSEIEASSEDIRKYLSQRTKELLQHEDIEFAVLGNVRGDNGRANLIFKCLKEISGL